MGGLVVGIGCDHAQELPAEVLRFSIARHMGDAVEVVKLHQTSLWTRLGASHRREQRTPFSLQRFLLAGLLLESDSEAGLYLDSDMVVLRPLDGLVEVFRSTEAPIATVEPLASWRRRRQSSVMIMDRAGASQLWAAYQRYLAGAISYDELIYLRTVGPIGTLPHQWNCLEYVDDETALIHYTDMDMQPWLRNGNPNAGLWYSHLARMVSVEGEQLLEREISAGHVRPSLREVISSGASISAFSTSGKMQDLWFVPPHRFRRVRSKRVRQCLAPILRGILNLQILRANGQLNIR